MQIKSILFLSAVATVCLVGGVSACDMSQNGGVGLWGCRIVNYIVNGTQINMCGFDPINHYCKLEYGGQIGDKYPGHCVPYSAIVNAPAGSWFDAGDHSATGLCPRCPSSLGGAIGCVGNPACGGGSDGCGTCQTSYGPWGWTQQCA